MFNLGLKIGSKDTQYTDDILRYYDEGVFQYIELFAIPGTYNDTISYWKQFNIPIGIHAPHSAAGLNLANRFARNDNKKKINEVFQFADELKAEYIIFHSGMDGTCMESIQQLKSFSDERMLIENKPIKGIAGGICIGTHYEELKYILEELKAGFCLDFGHAICAANSLKTNPIEYIRKLLDFNPRIYHLTDGEYDSEIDSHLHYGEGSFPIKEVLKLIPEGSKITNEAKRKDISSLNEFRIDFERLNEYTKG